jgi:molybdopterin synthase sulfur carrier subunit
MRNAEQLPVPISVKYFANLRELIGRSEDVLEFREGMTVADVWNQVKGGVRDSTEYLTALNMEYANNNAPVKDGDEVAFFPKVSGG